MGLALAGFFTPAGGKSLRYGGEQIVNGAGHFWNWMRRGANNVPKNIGGAFENTVKSTFRTKIIMENEILRDASGKIIGEIDFETAEALVEVGSSLKGKVGQLNKLAEVAQQRGKRLDVIYGPDTSAGTLEFLKSSLRQKYGNRVRFIPHGF